MDLRQLRYLVAVVDHATMTEAAIKLHVSQPALSRAIRNLEAELQISLFDRVGRNIVAARGAEEVIAAARRVCRGVDDLERVARAVQLPLVVCTTPNMELLLTRRVLPSYSEAKPDCHVKMLHGNGPDQIEQFVLNGQAELGLIDRTPDLRLVASPFAEEDVVLLSPATLDLPDPVPLELLNEVRLILPPAGSPRRREVDRFFDALGISPPIALETDERSAWIDAVIANIGSVLLPAANVEDARQRGARSRSLEPPLGFSLYLIHRAGQLSPAASAFLDAACPPAARDSTYRRADFDS